MSETHGSTSQRSRRQRLRELMDRRKLGALLLRRAANFAWYTNGADNRVDHASPLGVADVLVTQEAEYIFTNNIEAPRMREEQTPNFEVVERSWYGDETAAVREVIGDASLGTDFPLEVAQEISSEVTPPALHPGPRRPWALRAGRGRCRGSGGGSGELSTTRHERA